MVSNASAQAIRRAQAAFSGAAETIGVADEADVQVPVDEVRSVTALPEELPSI